MIQTLILCNKVNEASCLVFLFCCIQCFIDGITGQVAPVNGFCMFQFPSLCLALMGVHFGYVL